MYCHFDKEEDCEQLRNGAKFLMFIFQCYWICIGVPLILWLASFRYQVPQ